MAELNFPDFLGTATRGYASGAAMRDDRRQQDDLAKQRALAPAIVGGDLAAYQNLAATSPEAAQQLQGAGDVTFKRLAGAYKLVDDARKSNDIRAVNAALKQTAPFFSQVLGKPVPTEWTPDMDEGWGKLGQQIAMATQGGGQGKVFAQKISDDGYLINTYADGTVQKTDQKVDRQAWFRDQEGLPPTIVNKDGSIISPGAPASAMAPPRAGALADADPVAARLNAYREQLIAAGLQPGPQLDAAMTAAEQTLWQADAPVSGAPQAGLPTRAAVNPVEAQRMQNDQQRLAMDSQRLDLAVNADQRAATAAEKKNNKPMPPAIFKLREETQAEADTASGINTSLQKHLGRLSSGKLEFGPLQNKLYEARNFAGQSDEGSRNYAEFKSDLEKLRNDSLRLNAGVQTDGDAQRAWNELFANLNDTDLVKQRLSTILELNKRAETLKRASVERLDSEYGGVDSAEDDDLINKYLD